MGKINAGGLTESDSGALNEQQRVKLRQLKVDVEKLDQKYIRVSFFFSLKKFWFNPFG